MIHRPTPNLSILINCLKFYKNSTLPPPPPPPNFSKSTSQLDTPAVLAFPVVPFLTDKLPFFSKFFSILALTLLVFAGQVSAQRLSLTHDVTDGTAGIKLYQGGIHVVHEVYKLERDNRS